MGLRNYPILLSDTLLAIRKKQGWSRAELAERIGVTERILYSWEQKRTRPPHSMVRAVEALAKQLEVDTQPRDAAEKKALQRAVLLSAKLQALQNKQGLSQAAFARQFGISMDTLVNWKYGHTKPPPDKAQAIDKMAKKLGIEITHVAFPELPHWAATVHAIRTALGVSTAGLGQRLGMAERYVNVIYWEAGLKTPSLRNAQALLALAKELGIQIPQQGQQASGQTQDSYLWAKHIKKTKPEVAHKIAGSKYKGDADFDNWYASLPSVLGQMRKKLGSNGAQLAQLLASSEVTVYFWERRNRRPSRAKAMAIEKLAQELDIATGAPADFSLWDAGVPELLRAIRLKLDLSQQQLAHRLGVCLGSLGYWENGHTRPEQVNFRVIQELAQELGIDTHQLKQPP